jgi:hypothetical protein
MISLPLSDNYFSVNKNYLLKNSFVSDCVRGILLNYNFFYIWFNDYFINIDEYINIKFVMVVFLN